MNWALWIILAISVAFSYWVVFMLGRIYEINLQIKELQEKIEKTRKEIERKQELIKKIEEEIERLESGCGYDESKTDR